MFPRSVTDDPARHGTFDDVIARLAAHPRHGLRRALFPADPSDRHAPTARAATTPARRAGRSRQPLRDRRRRRRARRDPSRSSARSRISAGWSRAAREHGLEIALDFAIQCSPDHPWLREHPDWFDWRPDGSHRYAENPPKKYEDIVNVDFYAPRRDARRCGWRCATSCCSGSTRACASSASTIRTPSRCRSGNG